MELKQQTTREADRKTRLDEMQFARFAGNLGPIVLATGPYVRIAIKAAAPAARNLARMICGGLMMISEATIKQTP